MTEEVILAVEVMVVMMMMIIMMILMMMMSQLTTEAGAVKEIEVVPVSSPAPECTSNPGRRKWQGFGRNYLFYSSNKII